MRSCNPRECLSEGNFLFVEEDRLADCSTMELVFRFDRLVYMTTLHNQTVFSMFGSEISNEIEVYPPLVSEFRKRVMSLFFSIENFNKCTSRAPGTYIALE